ncbi:MAG: replication-associated recombination protein A [Candidatus Moraniibacteriota bacterium]|nr:MAG: replication-associated recombination protein A [Candidatus Moranbacteria bacterium]
MRPRSFEEFLGQEEILGEGTLLRESIRSKRLPSLILWGPPGSGKTTLALLLAHEVSGEFLKLSAVGSGVKELRAIIERAEGNRQNGGSTILFIDEIHRWNKSQQDALLPHVERGTITLIGATTENPSFEVNPALLSRTQVIVFRSLSPESLASALRHALLDTERGLGKRNVQANDDAIRFLAERSSGDARVALNALEVAATLGGTITKEHVRKALTRPRFSYDKGGEEHYNIISALHKSLRGSDANAALYWLARMLEGGEDPLYIARRLLRFASEDVGLANSFALPQVIAAYDACRFLGMPECGVHLAQAVVYLARSKKSNALYVAYESAMKDARDFPSEPVPLHLRNAPTKLMKGLGYGKEYKYTPDFEDAEEAKQEYFPEKLSGRKYVSFGDES